MDWTAIFDEARPEPGATDDMIARFIAEVRQPMSAEEAREINAGQRNPFPITDPLHAHWKPFDAGLWVIPDRPLPPDYLSLLRWSNGGEFRSGKRWFQFFPALDPNHGVRAMLVAYYLPEYMPGALPIAFDGGGTFYLLDMRQPAVGGEYAVVCAHSGYLAWESDAYHVIARSLAAACQSVDDIGRR